MNLLRKVSPLPIAFGGASISGEGRGYGFGDITEDQSQNLLSEAFEFGIKVYDTAPIYGFGLSEKRIGTFAKNKRDQVFIVSKCGVDWHQTLRVNMTNDPKIAERMLGESLKRLNSDYIDLYMIHWPDARVDIRRTWEVLLKAKEQGKILHLGLCNTNTQDLELVKELAPAEVVQSELNYFQRQNETLFPYLKENKISFMSWGTFDKGVLTGRVFEGRKYDASDLRSHATWWKKENRAEKFLKLEEIKKQLEKKEHSLTEFSLGYNLSHEEVEIAICGFRNSEQLKDGLQSLKRLVPKSFFEN